MEFEEKKKVDTITPPIFFFYANPELQNIMMPTMLSAIGPTDVWITVLATLATFFVYQYRWLIPSYIARWHLRFLAPSCDEQDIKVSGIHIYPLKSARGCDLSQATLDEMGLAHDRRLLAVKGRLPDKDNHRFLTQRQAPHLVSISTLVEKDKVTLTSPMGQMTLDVSKKTLLSAKRLKIGIWEDQAVAADLGDQAAKYIQSVIHPDEEERNVSFGDTRLVSVLPNNLHARRSITTDMSIAAYHRGKAPQIAMADAFPLLIISEESLQALNDRLVKKGRSPVPMKQFRPNIVVKGCEAFAEDYWKAIKVGDVTLFVISSCPRCKMSCIDQDTGSMSMEPLETLSEFREFGNEDEAYFGVYAVAQECQGQQIKVGDKVTVLLDGDPTYGE